MIVERFLRNGRNRAEFLGRIHWCDDMSKKFDVSEKLSVEGGAYAFQSLPTFEKKAGVDLKRLPFSLKILLENLLRNEDGVTVGPDEIVALANWDPKAEPDQEIAFRPSRVLLQDFTGVPVVVDLAAMRDAMKKLGGDPSKINPLQPVELVIDHSVQVDLAGVPSAFKVNADFEFERNQERYAFLRWGQNSLRNFRVVPPDTGIVHQVNLEYLARVVFTSESNGLKLAYPDTLVGTDSHTTMINGLGVLGWGVGGIEAEAAMLGQPVSMLVPQVVGFKINGKLPEGATATDLVLTVTQMLRKKGVVGKFVEFYGDGLASLSLADRATIANMAPEYGATCGIFPIDQETLNYLELTGRSKAQIKLVEAYFKAQGMFHGRGAARGRVHRYDGARSEVGRALLGWPQASPGSRAATRREKEFPRRLQVDARGPARSREARGAGEFGLKEARRRFQSPLSTPWLRTGRW